MGVKEKPEKSIVSSQNDEKVKEYDSVKNKKLEDSKNGEVRNKDGKEKIHHKSKERDNAVNIQSVFIISGYSSATITNNIITNNGYGIYLYNASYNIIERNIIKNNTLYDTGVHIESGSFNEIHENCFINNEPQAYDDGTNNNWDRNYWDPPIDTIPGLAGAKDNDPLPYCPCFPRPQAKAPTLTPIGLIALISSLLVVAVRNIKKK